MNKAERELVEQADQLLAIIESLRARGLGKGARRPPRPVEWPTLKPGEAKEEWESLREWVERLRVRFPNGVRLPDCWWRHNDLVEVLAALRDYERACFTEASAGTSPVEWQRALRDMEARMEIWIKRFTCTVSGRGHDLPDLALDPPPGWDEFLQQDTRRRAESAIAAQPAEAQTER